MHKQKAKDQQIRTDYSWKNREEFQNDNIQQLADKLIKKQPEVEETSNVNNLFDRIMNKSSTALLYFNQNTKQMKLHSLPYKSSIIYLSSPHIGLQKKHSNSKNYFEYGYHIKKMFGGRGTSFGLSAIKKKQLFQYGIQYKKTLWERIDNNFSSNLDKIGVVYRLSNSKYYDNFSIHFLRQSRQNYLNFISQFNENQKLFGSSPQQSSLLKHSNLLALKFDYKYSWLNLNCKFGWDYGNKSLFARFASKVNKSYKISNKVTLNLSLEWKQIFGNNVLKNDYLFRNLRTWPGDRTKNFLTPRIEAILTQFPYLSLLQINPYVYTQLWGSFKHDENGAMVTKVQADYGVGLAINLNSRLDFSLLKISTEKTAGAAFGAIKFSF